MVRKIGEVVYELELSGGSKIHNVFHVYCLKKYIGQKIFISYTLPPFYDELKFSDMGFGDSRASKAKDWVEESQEFLKILKDKLQVAQN